MEEHGISGIGGISESGTAWAGEFESGEGLDSLREVIKEIKDLIEERKTLSSEFIKGSEKIKIDINNFLLESNLVKETNPDLARERAELRRKQIEISELQLNEKIGCWRDIAVLKKELRERTKELNEKESRAKMLDKILKE